MGWDILDAQDILAAQLSTSTADLHDIIKSFKLIFDEASGIIGS